MLSQLPIDRAAVAAIDGSPVLERPQLVIGVVMLLGMVQQDEEALEHVKQVVVLAQGEKGIRAVALLRWRRAGAADTDGVALA
jgi:hypothetical protein